MDDADEFEDGDRAFPVTRPGALTANFNRPQRPDSRPGAGRCVESSCDLQRGLTVREGLPVDASVDDWISAWLRGG